MEHAIVQAKSTATSDWRMIGFMHIEKHMAPTLPVSGAHPVRTGEHGSTGGGRLLVRSVA